MTLHILSLSQTHVLHKKLSGARMFVLNRPEKLNALNLSMIRNIGPQLKAWEVSTLAKVIIMKSTGKGKFSVGDDILGNVKYIHTCICIQTFHTEKPFLFIDILQKANARDPDALYFFQDKFSLVQMIATLQTPYISILDGYACKRHCVDMNKSNSHIK